MFSTLQLDKNDIATHYEAIMNQTSLDIDKQGLQLESYTKNRDNLNYDNFMVKCKLNKMFETSETYTKQYENYKLIHDRANSEMKKKLNMVDKLADYNGLTKIKYDNDIQKKKKTFHNQEMQIANIKQMSLDQSAELKRLEKDIARTNAAVKEQQRRNFHSNNSNLSQKY